MALIIPNIGVSSINDPSTGAPRAFFSKMDSVKLDGDFKLAPQHGGSGMLPIAYTSADRNSKITLSGIEVPLSGAASIIGGTNTIAAAGTPVQIPINKAYTIPNGGVLNLSDNDAISATVTAAYVMGAADGKAFTGVARANTTLSAALSLVATTTLSVAALTVAVSSGDTLTLTSGANTQTCTASANAAIGATSITVNSFTPTFAFPVGTTVSDTSQPAAGSFVNPAAGATSIIFNPSDAGKVVYASYTIDSTTGGAVHASATSIPNTQKFIASGKILSTEDPNSALVPITIVIPKCIFIGTWSISQERQKASSNSIQLDLMDPGAGQDIFTIYTSAKFAG